MKRWIKVLCAIFMLACIFPVCVHAEGPTYIVISDECFQYFSSNQAWANVTGEVRAVGLKYGASNVAVYIVTDDPDVRYINDRSACSITPSSTLNHVGNYYLIKLGSYSLRSYTSVVPFVEANDTGTNAIYYTYGAGAVDPDVPTPTPIIWGLLRDVSYQSRIAGQGSASIRNVDYLRWDPVADANGNDISDCEVEIQACYGKFTASDLTGLFELDYQDIVIEDSVSLATVPASQGTYSISWGAVINELNGWDYQSLYAHNVNDQIQKNGWYYQIRLIGSDDNLGQWQTMYTPLSQSAKASEMILNQNSYNMTVYQIYEQLTQINNQVSITVDFNGTEYTVQNPDDGDEPQEGTDYWNILRQMLNGIVQIVGNIQKLPERLFAKVEELFTPQELDDTFHQQFTEQYEDYMASEQTTIYDFLDGVEALEPYVESLAPGDTGAHACILTWEDVTLDLTSFGAGEVTFIQGGTFSLTNAFLDVIHAFGLTYEDYEFLASAVIYLWLCVFIWHKFIHFLEKE